MKVESCLSSFDYFLSNNQLEHIYKGPEEARSALISPQSYTFNNYQNSKVSFRDTNLHHQARTLSNNRRTLSLTSQRRCVRDSFALQNQEDYSPRGWYIHPYINQFIPELTIETTIINNCGKTPSALQCDMKGYLPPNKYHQPLKRNTSE